MDTKLDKNVQLLEIVICDYTKQQILRKAFVHL